MEFLIGFNDIRLRFLEIQHDCSAERPAGIRLVDISSFAAVLTWSQLNDLFKFLPGGGSNGGGHWGSF